MIQEKRKLVQTLIKIMNFVKLNVTIAWKGTLNYKPLFSENGDGGGRRECMVKSIKNGERKKSSSPLGSHPLLSEGTLSELSELA